MVKNVLLTNMYFHIQNWYFSRSSCLFLERMIFIFKIFDFLSNLFKNCFIFIFFVYIANIGRLAWPTDLKSEQSSENPTDYFYEMIFPF